MLVLVVDDGGTYDIHGNIELIAEKEVSVTGVSFI